MLAWTSRLRNALMLIGLGACFVLATLVSLLVGGADEAAGPVERLATASPRIEQDAEAIYAMRPHRLDHTATPVGAPSLQEILDSVLVLSNAGLIAPLPEAPISSVAPAIATPTATPAPMRQYSASVAQPTEPLPPPPPPPPPPAPTPPARQAQAWSDAAYTLAVWDAVNAIRAARGLPPLRADAALAGVASSYAYALAGARWFSHTGPDGSTMGQRLAAAGVAGPAGEVLAMGTNGWPAEAVAQAWLDSAPHREQILGPYGRAGLDCAFSKEDGALVVRCVMLLAA